MRKMKTVHYARIDVTKDANITLDDYELMWWSMEICPRIWLIKILRFSVKWLCSLAVANLVIRFQFKKQQNSLISSCSLYQTISGSLKSIPDSGRTVSFHSFTLLIPTAMESSVDEFAVYYNNIMAVDLSREESKRSFDIIDADKNGEISYEEFMKAAEDFYRGTEETELSKAFFGPLVD